MALKVLKRKCGNKEINNYYPIGVNKENIKKKAQNTGVNKESGK